MNEPEAQPEPRGTPFWKVRNVLALGLVSLLTDTSSEMAIPLLPIFLTSVLGASAITLGWIEGMADALASVLKLISGRWADRTGRKRPFVIAGYTLSSLSRPLLALATLPGHVLAVRLADRTGKGLRTSPRDTLLAASVPPDQRGSAFGLHRAMDHAGAVLGPLVAVVLLSVLHDNLRAIFWFTAVPGALAVFAILAGVRERRDEVPAKDDHPTKAKLPAGPVNRATLRFLVPLGVFALGNSSDVFLLLKVGAHRAPLTSLPLLWMGLHVVKSLASVPGGRLADRWGRRKTIALGWGVYVAVYLAFAFATTQTAFWGLFLVYGIFHGLTEGPEKALIAELAPGGRQGTTFGWYYLTLGLLAIPASVLFGALWDRFGSPIAFLTGAGLALLALMLLGLLAPRASQVRAG